MAVKFIHLRVRDPFFGHLEPTGGVTVAYDIEADNTVRYAWAVCHPKEHYCKKEGRLYSTDRLAKGFWWVRQGGGRKSIKETVQTFPKVEGVNVVEQILKHHDSLPE
jgi:hypothetical protein